MNSISINKKKYNPQQFYISKYSKYKFIILSIKSLILPTIFCLFTLSLILFSASNLVAAKSGLILWVNNVIPSLFPFFIAVELLNTTNIVFILEKILTPIMKPLFNVPGCRSISTSHGNY